MNTVPGIYELIIFHSTSTHQPVVSNIFLKLHCNRSVLFKWRIEIPTDVNRLQRLVPNPCLILIWEIVLGDLAKHCVGSGLAIWLTKSSRFHCGGVYSQAHTCTDALLWLMQRSSVNPCGLGMPPKRDKWRESCFCPAPAPSPAVNGLHRLLHWGIRGMRQHGQHAALYGNNNFQRFNQNSAVAGLLVGVCFPPVLNAEIIRLINIFPSRHIPGVLPARTWQESHVTVSIIYASTHL